MAVPNQRGLRHPASFAVVAAILAVCALALPPAHAKRTYPSAIQEGSTVPHYEWQLETPFATPCKNALKPVVLTNTAADTWPAAEEWTIPYLVKHVEGPVGVKSRADPVFYPGCCTVNNVSISEFFERAQQVPDSGEYIYLSIPAADLGQRVFSDIDDLSYFRAPTSGEFEQDTRVFAWFGSPGVVTDLHHDYMSNFFYQIKGTKTFTLFPPKAWRELYLYPRTSFKHRQLRVDLSAPDLDRFPRFADIEGGVSVTVEPGDLLYVPPMWFHTVEAHDLTFSVNVWSTEEALTFFDRAWREELPFEPDDLDDFDLIAMGTVFLRTIVDKLFPVPGEASAFVRDMAETRFVDDGSVDMSGFSEGDPDLIHYNEYKERMAETEAFFEDMEADELVELCAVGAISPVVASLANKREFGLATEGIYQIFSTPDIDVGVFEIYFGHFVEDFAAQLVGWEMVREYLNKCLVDTDVSELMRPHLADWAAAKKEADAAAAKDEL